MELNTELKELKGVGEKLSTLYESIGLNTVNDLINYLPRKYDDYSKIQKIAELKPGKVTLKAKIIQTSGRYVRRGLHITEAVASDNSGSVRLTWFNQPYRSASLKKETAYYISGNFEFSAHRLSIINPSVEMASSFPISSARIVPVYRVAKGVKSAQLRRLVKEALPQIDKIIETLPSWLLKDNKMLSRRQAVRAMHFPESSAQLSEAKRRLGFEEVFELSLASLLNKYELLKEHSLKIPFNLKLAREFVKSLPFKLTDAQRKVVWQIYSDIQKNVPMNRLIEGDVGSGKTVVAAMAALMAIKQGFQVALMAPTEILARQHAETFYALFTPMGYSNQVGLLVGSLSAKQKSAAHIKINDGVIRLVIGTHALISEKVNMSKLGLVVIDEQHRFGVEQRKKLAAKAGHAPHILSMTATPIPRSLALTLYSELDLSLIDYKPPGRKEVNTKMVAPTSTTRLYEKIKIDLKKGRQMFVVCPLITESQASVGSSVEAVYKEISKVFSNFKVGLLHGKLKNDQKTAVMADFARHKIDILVSTTVIEVGVDIPNATIMLIKDAERFGLAQIHQLRGRVGRGQHQSNCYLMTSDGQAQNIRLKSLETLYDGFKLAELDLKLRGPGAIYGNLQHGLLDLKVASLTDAKLIAQARAAAQEFIDKDENLLKYKQLNAHVKKLRAVTNLN